MVDVVNRATRSRMMSGIRGGDTRPEMFVRRLLHREGFRYKLHVPSLPGKPDLVFPKYQAIILVNGCFWHGHDCHLFKWPATRATFWKEKIGSNIKRDNKNITAYKAEDWRTCIVWECAIKGRQKISHEKLLNRLEQWLMHGQGDISIP